MSQLIGLTKAYPPTGGFICRCSIYFTTLFVSHVSPYRCELYTVVRTDLRTWDRTELTYPPSDMPTAVRRADWYQRTFDPDHQHYDWRCGRCS